MCIYANFDAVVGLQKEKRQMENKRIKSRINLAGFIFSEKIKKPIKL